MKKNKSHRSNPLADTRLLIETVALLFSILGKQGLEIDVGSIRISYKGLRLMDKGNLPPDKIDESQYHTGRKKVHPTLKGILFSFVYIKNKYDKNQNRWIPNPDSLYPEEVANEGFSDHFSIRCLINII